MRTSNLLKTLTFLLAFTGLSLFASHADARGVSVYDGTNQRPSSTNGGSFLNGNDIKIAADTNCCWLYINVATPAYWSNNVSILGTGYGTEKGGALRFGEGGSTLTQPMILTGDVTFLGNATIGVQANSLNATGLISGQLKIDSSISDPSSIEFLYRGRADGSTTQRDMTGTLVLTADSTDFTAPIRVGSGVLQLGCINSYTATGYEWVSDGAGGEKYQQNTAKKFTFDGSTGSVGSSTINLTSVFDSKTDFPTLRFQRSGSVTVNNAITGNGNVEFDGTATYTLGSTGSFATGLKSVTVNKGATLVNNYHAGTTKKWDFTNAVSGAGFYQVNYSDQADIKSSNTCTTLWNATFPISVSGFTGTYIFADGYRFNLSGDWNVSSKGYSLGATDYGQIWMQGTAKYTGDMYLKGTGWSTAEYRGALRFGGSYSENLSEVTSMTATYGNIYLMGDTRVALHADKATVALIASDIKNYGDGSYTLEVATGYAGNILYFTGTSGVNLNLNDATTFQVGHQGTINGTTYDGTTGDLGSGDVKVGGSATLKFMRTGDVTVGSKITNSGKIVFDGGANYTASKTISGGTVEIKSDSKLTTTNGITSTITGEGTLQLNNPGEATGMPTISTSNFTGIIFAGKEYRWNPGTSTTYDVGAVDSGQLWFTSLGDYTQKNVYLAGTGWSSSERFGALRFAGSTTKEKMANVTGTVHLLGDTSMSSRMNATGVYGMISGNIDGGTYALTIDSKGSTGTIILTGTNTYGATNINANDTLVVGWIGTVNDKTYDGSTGTLGTGDVTVSGSATLQFNRSGNVTISNQLGGTGAVVFDGTASYTVDPTKLGTTLKSVTVKENAKLTLTGEISSDVSAKITTEGTSNPIQVSGSKIDVTVSEASETKPGLTFTNEMSFQGSNTLQMDFAKDFTPELGETYYLFSGTTNTMKSLDLNALQTVTSELPTSMFWTYSLQNYGSGQALMGTLNVPEPATWVLLLLGTCLLWGRRFKRR